MKFSFKKIASVLASAVMLGSTIGIAAAATNYPAPFVTSGGADVTIVAGAASPSLVDSAAAINIVSDLSTELSKLTITSSESTQCSSDDGTCKKLEKAGTDLFNLGDDINDFYSTLDDDELSTVLAAGIFSNDANDEYEYEQEILLGTTLVLSHFHDSSFNDDKPVIGFNLSKNTFVFNYTLEFTPDAADAGGAWASGNELETTDLTMLGRTYYVLSARNTSLDNHKLTLLDSANSATVTEGEPSTITVGDKSYVVSISSISDSYVVLDVDGKSTGKLSEGGTYKVTTDTYVAVKNNLYTSKDSGISKVEISIGSGKIEIENGQEVKLNGDEVSDIEYTVNGTDEPVTGIVTSYLVVSGDDLQKIVLEWELDNKVYLGPGSELTFPGFETLKLSYDDFNFQKAEKTTISNDGDDAVELSTTIKEGDITFDFLSLNSSQTAFDGIGKDADTVLATNWTTNSITINLNESEDTMFPVSWKNGDDYESYLFQISKIEDENGKNKTTLKNLASDGTDIVLTEVTDDKDKGEVKLTLAAANDDEGTATLTLTRASGSTGTLYADRLISEEGLSIRLPVIRSNGSALNDGEININATSNPATWTMNFTEEDKDGNIGSGKSFTVVITPNADDGGEPSSTSVGTAETEDDSDKYIGYVYSALATEVLWDNPSTGLDSMDITYHGEEAYADVFVSESQVSFSTGATTIGSVVVDTALTATEKAKNLIVVGGSCVNTVAEQLLGGKLCGDAFTASTGIGTGQFLVKVFQNPYADSKIAMLVAGYEAADTSSAVTYVTQEAPATDAGTVLKKTTTGFIDVV